MSGKERDWFMEMPIKRINYCSICEMGILNWIIRFEEITQTGTNVLSYQKFKKERSAWTQMRSQCRKEM